LQLLYSSPATDDEKRTGKLALMAELGADYATMKRDRWAGFSGYDGWFARANNASFGVLAAYNELVPDFERLFEREGRDFPRFYGEVKRLAGLPFAQRRSALLQ
jgi:predicted aminopeptidase